MITSISDRHAIYTRARLFEQIVGKILRQHYHVKDNQNNTNNHFYDFELSNGINIEVKFSSQNNPMFFLRNINERFFRYAKHKGDKVIFITNLSGCTDIILNRLSKEIFSELHFLTLENLIFLCGDNEELKTELISCIPFSTENLVATPLGENLLNLLRPAELAVPVIEISNSILFGERLKEIKAGTKDCFKFEKFCKEFVETIFYNNIENITEQKRANKKLYRYDLVASIKDDPNKFWKFIYDKFNSCFILFECKNYKEKITQEQIYLTARYLYNTALRNVAIILTRKGAEKSALLATQDVLKEQGKLILILDDTDIESLEEIHRKKDDDITPSDYLLDKAKDFLLNLDK